MRGETRFCCRYVVAIVFQSTPLMRGETFPRGVYVLATNISIHSPHARGDIAPRRMRSNHRYFNPLPSCEGRRVINGDDNARGDFNPLPSCEGRLSSAAPPHAVQYFNPLPSCEGRQQSHALARPSFDFNPLPSCEGRQSWRAPRP